MLQAKEITAGYNGRAVVYEVSLDVAPGELVALVGPNGSGKTTLLRVLARVLPPLSGTLSLSGQPLEAFDPRAFARQVAYAPQENAPDMGFTVWEMVMMGRHPHQKGFFGETAADREAVSNALQKVDLLPLANRLYGQLSGGERQRVNLARALAQDATWLLLDEPTAHLDLRNQVRLLSNLRRWVQGEGLGILCVLHDLNLASEYADRIVLLHRGYAVAEGEPAQVLRSELLEQIYETPVFVRPHPLSGRPLIFPLPQGGTQGRGAPGTRLHVIAGGGSGAALFYPLLEVGARVTTGVNNLMDTDEEVARALGLEQVTEAPFSPVSESAFQRALSLIADAQVVIIADMPFGRGNLPNLKLAMEAVRQGKPVLALCTRPIEDRDFTDGEASRLWQALLQSGLQTFDSLDALLEVVETLL